MDRRRQWLQFSWAIFLKSLVFVPRLAWMMVFDVFQISSILRVPSKSNGYLENVGGYPRILIGTLNAPKYLGLNRNVSVFVKQC